MDVKRKAVSGILVTLLLMSFLTPIFNIQMTNPAIATSGGLVESPWPMFGHDAQHTARSQYVGPHASDVVWSSQFEYKIRSLIIDKNDRLYALAYAPSGTGDFKIRLYAINADGTLEWSFVGLTDIYSITPCLSAAVGLDGNVYVPDNSGKVYAIDPEGSVEWTYQQDLSGRPSSVTVAADGTLYFVARGTDSKIRLFALNPDGSLKWSYECLYWSWNFDYPPAICQDGTVYVTMSYTIDYAGHMYAVAPDGTLKWEYITPTDQGFRTPPSIGPDGTIYAGTHGIYPINGMVYAINPDGTIKWSSSNLAQYINRPLGIGPDGTIYVRGGSRGKLIALDPNDGNIKWIDSDSYETGIVIGADGILYVSSQNTRGVRAVYPDGSTVWSSVPESSGVGFPLAIGLDGTLYATIADKLYAFGTLIESVDISVYYDYWEYDVKTTTETQTTWYLYNIYKNLVHTYSHPSYSMAKSGTFGGYIPDGEDGYVHLKEESIDGGIEWWPSASEMYKIERPPSEKILSAWAHVVPTIDGVISANEWDDSSFFDISNKGIEGHPDNICYLYVKNDESYLYVAFDTVSDSDLDGPPPDRPYMAGEHVDVRIDGDHSGDYPVNPQNDVMYRLFAYVPEEYTDHTGPAFQATRSYRPEPNVEYLYHEPISTTGIGQASSISGHAQYELKIPFSEFEYELGNTVGVFFSTYNLEFSIRMGQFPDDYSEWTYIFHPEYWADLTTTPPENQPPTCSIKLRKEGVEISEIDVGEFLDIYVGDSTDDTGIKQVRFSSDDVQEGIPTGEWTEWYVWDTSSGDWDASTKIKRWAFATGGDKEVWAEVKDDIGQTAKCSATIHVNESLRVKIARLITQEAIGGVPVTVDGQLYIILTLKSYIDPITLEVVPNVMTKVYVESSENYPVSDPEIARKIGIIDYVSQLKQDDFESHLYEKCEYLMEQLLVIGTIPLAEWPIEAIESIPIIIKISAQKLIEKLIDIAGEEVVEFLLNTKEEVRNQVEEDYGNAWNEYFLAWKILMENDEITDYDMANSFLENNLTGKFYEDMGHFLCTKIYPGGVWEFFVREIFKVLTWGVSEECLAIVISNDYYLKYLTEIDKIQCQLFKKPYGFASYTLELAQVPPELTEEYNKCILRIEENTIQIYEAFANYWEGFSFEDYLIAMVGSPVELRVYDLQERITGLLDGEAIESIPNSWYYNNIVAIFFQSGSYQYEVAGRGEGTYDLTVTSVEDGKNTSFTATEIPTSDNAIHQYFIDWDTLSQGKDGATLQIDSDSDGIFEQIITADSELTHDEFMLQTATTIDFDPDTLNLESKGKWVTVYIELPEGYDVNQIDVSSILLNDTVPPIDKPTEIGDYDDDGITDLMVKFDRQILIDYLKGQGYGDGGMIELTVTGEVSETRFEGFYTIRVIPEGKGN